MIRKRLILVLLAMFLVMGCVGAVSANDTPITSVSISGITAPVVGSAPSGGLTITTEPADNATSGSVSWVTSDDASFSGNFDYSTVYKAKFTLTAATECNFTGTRFNYVGDGNEEITLGSENKTADVVITFDETGTDPKTNIESITISGITAPIANTEPVTTNPTIVSSTPSASVTSSSTIAWKTASGAAISGNFTYETIYKANFTVSAAENYRLTSSTYVASNGGTSTILPNDDGTEATITVTFPITEQAPVTTINITSLSVTGLTEPVFGATPDPSVSVSGGGTPVSVSWYPSVSTTFAENTQYKATITVQNASGYVFTTVPTVFLNDDTMSSSNLSLNPAKTQLTITYTFPKTAAKILPTITLSTNITNNIGTVPLSVKFTYTATNFYNCTLIYGDGASSHLTSSSGNITHTYTTAGSYTASLIAKNVNGTTYENRSITVNKVGLAAAFTASHESGMAPLVVLFIDKSAGSPIKWVWDFGGLGSSMDKNPTFNFTKAGTYIVKLTVIDSTGATDSYSRVISVKAPLATSTPTQTAAVKSLTTASAETGNMSMIPAPLDIIKEFMHLFYSIFDPANYLFAVNESGNTS
ncbi:MAG: PKD domain-containing protein [Methanocorpusculum sp.]|uniref:PKD domain-containing protein n=1 Tax=Methanocorpusculum sp. TaxID=2058474 RepID=UPI002B1FF666|nr:PKD domain-containing protein [Methanocorpusculum sp.]MEA5086170.1 PKD domain-containing protein [Methanocorpusculum sp.]